jgi:hypothetical protein
VGKIIHENGRYGKYFSARSGFPSEPVDYFSTVFTAGIVPQNFGPAFCIRQKRKKVGEIPRFLKNGRFLSGFGNYGGEHRHAGSGESPKGI